MADCPGARVVEDPLQVAVGVVRPVQVGPLVSAPAGAVWVSLMPTVVRVTLPVFLATNW